jgi:hypothetical protein
MPDSMAVGTFGNWSQRFSPSTASATMRPLST